MANHNHRETLEQALVQRFRQQQRKRALRWSMLKSLFSRNQWLAFGAASLLIGVVAACRAPANYQVGVGQTVELGLKVDNDADAQAKIALLEQQVEKLRGDKLTVDLRRVNDRVSVAVTVVGGQLSADEIQEQLRSEVPGLAEVQVSTSVIHGDVHGTVGGRIGHALGDGWGIELDALSVADARERIIAELRGRGEEPSTVDVEDSPEGRRIKVRVEKRRDME